MSLYHRWLALSLLAALTIAPPAALGQTPGDTIASSPSDTQPTLSDSATGDAGSVTDSVRTDSSAEDTTFTDTTLIDSTLADSTLVDSTLVDSTLVDSTLIDSTIPDTFSTDIGPTGSALEDSIPEMTQGYGASQPDTAGSASNGIRTARGVAARVDTLRPALDSARTSGRDTVKLDSASTAMAPRDSILRVACGSGGTRSVAQDLLVVVFATEAGAAERAAAARTVNGKLMGQAEPGAYYMQVPTRGNEAGLRIAANQLSLLPQVRQVGSRACPSSSRETAS